MKKKWVTIVASSLMILAMVSGLCLGCGGGGEKEKVVIVVGNISDMTGVASSALVPINYAMHDLANYFNDQELIPGAVIKVVDYNAMYDPAQDVPAWESLKEKGAKVMVTALPTTAETLKSFAASDKIPLWSLTASDAQLEPPGWVFCAEAPTSALINTLLEWISESDTDFPADRRAKIGSAGWEEPYAISIRDAVKEYAQAHSDKFEWVAGMLAPMGVMTWSGEVEALKDCDYVVPPSTGVGMSTFMKEYRDKGYHAKFLGTDAHCAYRGLAIDAIGWAGVDGMLTTQPSRWWNETSDIVDLANTLIDENHSGQAAGIEYSGIGYIGSIHQLYAFYQVLQQAVKDVGAKNFDGQAFYDTAIGFKMSWTGYEEWGFTSTKRYTWNATGIYEWSAQQEDIVRKVPDWLGLVLD
jgi:ABC-type branched-subunit amino acid transport system substrate-binding protein